uniref:Uncharacterized protein n=1 Tax=Arundo donax TaxID=35708 RepID=A0A0A8ZCY9_ARUDO
MIEKLNVVQFQNSSNCLFIGLFLSLIFAFLRTHLCYSQ